MLFGFSAKTEPTATSTSTTTETTSYRSRDPMRSCTYCGRKEHEVSECFLLCYFQSVLKIGLSAHFVGKLGMSETIFSK